MAKSKYEITLEFLCREGGYDDDDKEEYFVYHTITAELEDDVAANVMTGSASPVDVPDFDDTKDCRECIVYSIEKV